jgi:hypothetical protein
MPIRRPRTNNWPPHSHLFAYDFDFGEWAVFDDTRNPKYDLSDNLSYMLNAGKALRLGIEIEGNTNWPVWDADSLDWMEKRIIWDFAFDGDFVKLTRITPERAGMPCSEEFIWLVENAEDTDD